MSYIITAVVKRWYRFRNYINNSPTEVYVIRRADSEDGARLNLPRSEGGVTYDWRLDAVLEDEPDAYL